MFILYIDLILYKKKKKKKTEIVIDRQHNLAKTEKSLISFTWQSLEANGGGCNVSTFVAENVLITRMVMMIKY